MSFVPIFGRFHEIYPLENSARAGELLVRKQMPEELFDTILIMDLAPADGAPVSKDTVDDQSSMEKRLQREDNIIETALSFVHDYYLKNIPIRILFYGGHAAGNSGG